MVKIILTFLLIYYMSRPINSTNKIKLTQTSSILQVQNVQGGNLSVQAGGTKSLDLDILNVKNI